MSCAQVTVLLTLSEMTDFLSVLKTHDLTEWLQDAKVRYHIHFQDNHEDIICKMELVDDFGIL